MVAVDVTMKNLVIPGATLDVNSRLAVDVRDLRPGPMADSKSRSPPSHPMAEMTWKYARAVTTMGATKVRGIYPESWVGTNHWFSFRLTEVANYVYPCSTTIVPFMKG